jgi:PAS domain S-box-containing protein
MHRFLDEAFLDALHDAVVSIGGNKRVEFINHAAERLLGYTREEAIGQPCDRVVQCAACHQDCLLERRRPINDFNTVLTNRAGQRISIQTNTLLFLDPRGKLGGGVEIIRERRESSGPNGRDRLFSDLVRKDRPLEVMERRLLDELMEEVHWNCKEAARRLGISRTTLWRRLKEHDLQRPAKEN